MFPGTGFGVDYVIPDYTYLRTTKKKLWGFSSHGHEDHIGASRTSSEGSGFREVYATGIAVSLIKNKLSNSRNLQINFVEYNHNSVFDFKNFQVSFLRTNQHPRFFRNRHQNPSRLHHPYWGFQFDFTPLFKHTRIRKAHFLFGKRRALPAFRLDQRQCQQICCIGKKIGEKHQSNFRPNQGKNHHFHFRQQCPTEFSRLLKRALNMAENHRLRQEHGKNRQREPAVELHSGSPGHFHHRQGISASAAGAKSRF